MKAKSLAVALFLGVAVLVGCSTTNTQDKNQNNTTNNGITTGDKGNLTTENPGDTDVVSSASLASDEETLKKALKDSWIVLLKNDITTSKDLVVEGDFTKPDKNDSSKMVPAGRTIALYENDDNNTTKSYTLTTPKITVKSKDTKIEGGTIIGDVYVEAEGFELENAKIEGNVYFSKQEYKDSFEMDDKSTVTGVQEVK